MKHNCKFKIGDIVNFGGHKATIENIYNTHGKVMYTIGSSRHGSIDIEAEEIDKQFITF